MENRKITFHSRTCNLKLGVYPGHFATRHSHVNYFIDLTTIKVRQSNAEEAANALVQLYKHNTIVDTIVCLDGTEVIGAFLAEKLTEKGFFSHNMHKSIYIVTPEIDSDGQMPVKETRSGNNNRHEINREHNKNNERRSAGEGRPHQPLLKS